jgi:hypothetical protein
MNRRSIIVMLIGVAAALTGFATASLVEQDRCLDAGGRWNAAVRSCQLAAGDVAGLGLKSMAAGVFVGILVAVVLYRTVLFFAMKVSRPSALS